MSTIRPGKSTRRSRRQAREAAHLAERQADAGDDPAANAALSWDLLRKDIKALPPARRASAWQTVRAGINDLRDDIRNSRT